MSGDAGPVLVRVSDGVIAERSGGVVMLVDANGTNLVTLNRVGSVLWDELDRPRSGDELVEQLGERYPGVERSRLAEDVADFLTELRGLGLVTDAPG